MSLILEALKRSEAERQIGKAPGLMTPVMATRRRSYSVGTISAWAIALACVVGIVTVFWFGAESTHLDSSSETDAAAAADRAAPPPKSEVPSQVPSGPSRSFLEAPIAADSRLDVVEQDSVSHVPAGTGSARMLERVDPTFTSSERESMPVPSESSDANSIDAVADEAARSIEARRVARNTVSSQLPDPVAGPSIGPDPASPSFRRLGELAASERDSLPPLRITMHVFVEEATARFVLLDGHKLSEGARISEGLVLREIRRDGIVVDHDGESLFVPRP